MPNSLENSRVQFALNPASGRWRLALREAAAPLLEEVEWGAAIQQGRQTIYRPVDPRATRIETRLVRGPASSSLHALCVEAELGRSGVRLRGEFALHEKRAALLVRLTLTNGSRGKLRGERFVFGRAGPAAVRPAQRLRPFAAFRAPVEPVVPGAVRLTQEPSELRCYINGWQSWSFAGALGENDFQPGPRLGPVTVPMHAGAAYPWPRERGHFTSDMFTVLRSRTSEASLTLGFLAQREQFGCVESWLDRFSPSLMMTAELDGVLLEPGEEIASDWAYVGLQSAGGDESFETYLDLAARENGARTTREPPFGWCSWYHYFTRVTDEDLRRNVAAAAQLQNRLPLKLIQLDDGFQADVGDWLERNAKFPRDMRQVAESIRAQGFTPGLWLAPLIAKPAARIVRLKPDWWLRGRWRRPANAGLVWFKWGRGLDVTQSEAVEHAAALIRTATHEWGFPYLKLDFLYASALDARRADPKVTRAQALRRALEAMRRAAGEDTFLLGCGCPLGSGIGIFDGMRIGTDVDYRWDPTFGPITPWIHGDPTFPSARNSIHATLSRATLHRRWWWNDPDCLLARDTHTRLTLDERRSLATAIGMSGGAMLVSDDLGELSEESLGLIQAFLPANTRAPQVIGWGDVAHPEIVILKCSGAVGEWHVVARFNWSESPIGAELDMQELDLSQLVEGFSFWDSRWIAASGGKLQLGVIPAHGVSLVALRDVRDAPGYLGDSLHFTQGMEIANWRVRGRSLSLRLGLGDARTGRIFLKLPGAPKSATLDHQPVAVSSPRPGVYEFEARTSGSSQVDIRW
jgi:alpha-galactosidase